jgi:hypothetical protein
MGALLEVSRGTPTAIWPSTFWPRTWLLGAQFGEGAAAGGGMTTMRPLYMPIPQV